MVGPVDFRAHFREVLFPAPRFLYACSAKSFFGEQSLLLVGAALILEATESEDRVIERFTFDVTAARAYCHQRLDKLATRTINIQGLRPLVHNVVAVRAIIFEVINISVAKVGSSCVVAESVICSCRVALLAWLVCL